MYGCESWTIKRTDHWRTDAFELWYWRLLRVPWTARRWNRSILKEINPEYSLEGLMLKLKFQYFLHLMQRANSLEKSPMLGKIEGSTENEMVGWYNQLNGHEFEQTRGDSEGQGSLVCYSSWVAKSWIWLRDWTITSIPTHLFILAHSHAEWWPQVHGSSIPCPSGGHECPAVHGGCTQAFSCHSPQQCRGSSATAECSGAGSHGCGWKERQQEIEWVFWNIKRRNSWSMYRVPQCRFSAVSASCSRSLFFTLWPVSFGKSCLWWPWTCAFMSLSSRKRSPNPSAVTPFPTKRTCLLTF